MSSFVPQYLEKAAYVYAVRENIPSIDKASVLEAKCYSQVMQAAYNVSIQVSVF